MFSVRRTDQHCALSYAETRTCTCTHTTHTTHTGVQGGRDYITCGAGANSRSLAEDGECTHALCVYVSVCLSVCACVRVCVCGEHSQCATDVQRVKYVPAKDVDV